MEIGLAATAPVWSIIVVDPRSGRGRQEDTMFFTSYETTSTEQIVFEKGCSTYGLLIRCIHLRRQFPGRVCIFISVAEGFAL